MRSIIIIKIFSKYIIRVENNSLKMLEKDILTQKIEIYSLKWL